MGNYSSQMYSNTRPATDSTSSAYAAEQGKGGSHNGASRSSIMSASRINLSKAPPPPSLLAPASVALSEESALKAEHEKTVIIESLQARFRCSRDCATSTVETFYPDEEKCRAVVQTKMTTSTVVVVSLVSKQREWLDMLRTDLRSAFAHFPFLNASMKDKEGHTAGGAATSLPPIDWAAVRDGLFADGKAPLYYEHTELPNIGVPNDLPVLENAYKLLVTKKGFSHLIGCFASGDGVVAAVDYVNERLRGIPVQKLARQMHFPAGVVDALNGIETSSPTPVHTRVNAFGNNPATSHSKRQDKGKSQEALRDAGLAYIRSIVTTSAEEAIEKIRDETLLLPVVVKPSTGAGSEFVTLCYTEEDVTVAFEMVDGMQTSQGTDATVLVVEEYIEGPEYVVNTVSYNGVAVVTDVWQSWKYPKTVYTTGMTYATEKKLRPAEINERRRKKTSILYDKQTLISDLASLPPNHEARRVVAYTLQCLDALELRNGCAHCELRVDMRDAAVRYRRGKQHTNAESATSSPTATSADTDVRGVPVLIELNPRMQGDAPRSTEVVGYDQFSLMVYIGEAVNVFGGATAVSTQLPFRGPSYSPVRGDIPWPPVPRLYHALNPSDPLCTTVLFLVASSDCILNGAALPHLTALKSFERFTRTIFTANVAGYVTPLRQTVDLFSSPSACVMRGTPEQVEADCTFIRAMETAEVTPITKSMLQDAVAKTERLRVTRTTLQMAERRVQFLNETVANRSAQYLGSSCDTKGVTATVAHASDREALLADAQAEYVRLMVSTTMLKVQLDDLRTAIKAELLNQSPPPLYICKDTFDLLKYSDLGSICAVV